MSNQAQRKSIACLKRGEAGRRARRPKAPKLAEPRLAAQVTEWLEEWWPPEETAGEAELGVSRDDEPVPAVGLFGRADLRLCPADVEAPDVGAPAPIESGNCLATTARASYAADVLCKIARTRFPGTQLRR